jgi:paired amphipathic helix protein Sin3a
VEEGERENVAPLRKASRKNVFFGNTVFYVLLRLVEVRVFLSGSNSLFHSRRSFGYRYYIPDSYSSNSSVRASLSKHLNQCLKRNRLLRR